MSETLWKSWRKTPNNSQWCHLQPLWYRGDGIIGDWDREQIQLFNDYQKAGFWGFFNVCVRLWRFRLLFWSAWNSVYYSARFITEDGYRCNINSMVGWSSWQKHVFYLAFVSLKSHYKRFFTLYCFTLDWEMCGSLFATPGIHTQS